ncbi:hypothetical protein [Bdellovibrio sp. HCB274]|uniref:hypothetical protein n=1 Tax=Bdellovibrio sp. HCB274 TaxID=3394361 RepID=UPI0039B5A132
MKTMLTAVLVLMAGVANAGTKVSPRIQCSGIATIEGSFSTKKVPVSFDFNVSDEIDADLHIAQVDGKFYGHQEGLSWCEKASGNSIICIGNGYGNGPELKVKIDLSTGKASGTYFNPWASHGIEVPNEYNTYQFTNLICR